MADRLGDDVLGADRAGLGGPGERLGDRVASGVVYVDGLGVGDVLQALPKEYALPAFGLWAFVFYIVALTTVAVTAWLTAALLILSGVPLAVHLILVLAIGVLVAGMAIAFILRVRQPVAGTADHKAARGSQPIGHTGIKG